MTDTSAIVDGCARVIADAVDGTVFAAGVTALVTAAETRVVPIADDWSEVGFPIVTVYLGPWAGTLQPGNERLKLTLNCAIWRERAELGVNTAALYADRDALADAWIARTKAYLAEATLQSADPDGRVRDPARRRPVRPAIARAPEPAVHGRRRLQPNRQRAASVRSRSMSSSRKKTRAGAATANPAAVLFYTGGGPIYGDAPARDLTTADLVRLVRIAGLRASGGEPVKPATPEQLSEMAAGLEASGAFSRAATSQENEAPADPAEEIV
jgi:hypothetical protein